MGWNDYFVTNNDPNIGFQTEISTACAPLATFLLQCNLCLEWRKKMLRCEIGNHLERYVLISLISPANFNGICTFTCPMLEGCIMCGKHLVRDLRPTSAMFKCISAKIIIT